MASGLTFEQQLSLISRAWGKQEGYCFFPSISGKARDKRERIQSYSEGPAFSWPSDRAKILEHMEAHQGDDLYWCPSLFEYPRRQAEVAMDEHALWADLDDVDPRQIEEYYRPTIAWETSPNRYQALWLISAGDMQNASWPGYENQRLTYYLGADNSGWDTTQLLRIPGWHNHKPDRRDDAGKPFQGKLIWKTGPRYLPDHFEDLPEVQSINQTANIILETELDRVDRHEVYARVKLRLPSHIRELIMAREVAGDRSEILWQIERSLADVGCSVLEIIAVVRGTVWNKYKDRADELKRLSIEAARAIDERPDDVPEVVEKRDESVFRIAGYLASIKPPKWLIRNIWAQGSCGFIAGQPKSFKSWFGLDMALSVSTGLPFLGMFPVVHKGPVLYVQEEDSAPMIKRRYNVIMDSAKYMEYAEVMPDGKLELRPMPPRDADPDIDVMIRGGMVISDPAWLEWLDERITERNYVALILDPLMMMLGEVEENKAANMTAKVFRPLKQLAEKHNTSIIVIHHMRKGDNNGMRGGQMMLGSVANHAWTEDSLYVTHQHGDLRVEVESKHSQGGHFMVTSLRNKRWTPRIDEASLNEEDDPTAEEIEVIEPTPRATGRSPSIVTVMKHAGRPSYTSQQLSEIMGKSTSTVYRQLQRAVDKGRVKRTGNRYALT